MFKYSENISKTFLIGTCRNEKSQLDWILGVRPKRFDKLYNIRLNQSLFNVRNGGVLGKTKPDFILIYDDTTPGTCYHLFPCINAEERSQDDMEYLCYPQPNGSYIVFTLGDEVDAEPLDVLSLINKVHILNKTDTIFSPTIVTGEIIKKYVDWSMPKSEILAVENRNVIRFIDLFAGIGGIRCGLEQAAREMGLDTLCVLTSEIKPYAVRVLKDNHPAETIMGDVTKIETKDIPDFDVLCAGFPCQAFSSAGKRQGFADTRGTMFFEVERILKDKRPKGFILENVEGLVNHDGGRTLQVIIDKISALGYKFDFKVLNSKYFGVPQERKRIYIVGSLNEKPDLDSFPVCESKLKDILETGLPVGDTPFIRNLLSHFAVESLYGKSIKDKRGGEGNIHSWDLEVKGPVSSKQKQLLDSILTERRKKKWASLIGIDWMDGMPLTLEHIKTFFDEHDLKDMLEDLTEKGYLKFEHPKKLVKKNDENGNTSSFRIYDESKPKGYNIVAGKLSFEVNKILSPDEIAPTLVAMDMQKLYVSDNGGIRRLSLREGLRLFGYPEDIKFNVNEKEGYDLLGNTVVVPVIKAVAKRLLKTI